MNKRIAFAGGLFALTSITLAAPSAAAGEYPFTFDEPAAVEMEYGGYWVVSGTSSFVFTYPTRLEDRSPSFPEGYTLAHSGYLNANYLAQIYLSAGADIAPLAVGSYPIDVTIWALDDYTTIETTLTVVPAQLATTVAIHEDPLNPGGAVVSATLSGRFTEYVAHYADSPSVAILPAGTWSFSITDSEGVVVDERTIDDPDGGPAGISYYWFGADRGSEYSVTGAFTPTTSGNFAIAPASPTLFRTDAAPRPVPVVEGPGAPEPEPVQPGLSVPLFVALLSGVVLVGLTASAVVLGIRGRKRTAQPVATEAGE